MDNVVNYPVNQEFIKVTKKLSITGEGKGEFCKIETEKFGIIKVHGKSYKDAFSNGIEICFQKLNNNYIATYKEYPGMDEQISFTRICTNIKCHQIAK